MNANAILLQKKYARVIELYAKKYHIPTLAALNRFYRSFLYHQISKGISDLHCMSNEYLAEELNEEWSQSSHYQVHFVRTTDSAVVIRFVSEEQLNLNIVRVVFYDDSGTITEADARDIPVVINEDGYCEIIISFPDNQSYSSVQLLVRDAEHQEQYSIVVMFDGTVNAHQLPYNSLNQDFTF